MDYRPLYILRRADGTFEYKRFDKTREDLKEDLQLSSATMAKLNKGKYISMVALDKLCTYLNIVLLKIVVLKSLLKHMLKDN